MTSTTAQRTDFRATTPALAKPSLFRPQRLLPPLLICATLSGVMTWLNVGAVNGFFWRWATSFVGALPVMVLGLALMAVYGRLLQRALPKASPVWRKLALALSMALTLELLMSAVVTLRNVGWAAGFTAAWAHAFVRSLPLGILIGLLMSFVVRPRLQRMAAA